MLDRLTWEGEWERRIPHVTERSQTCAEFETVSLRNHTHREM